jgi:hypothetical protein
MTLNNPQLSGGSNATDRNRDCTFILKRLMQLFLHEFSSVSSVSKL